ncbi:MAG: DUF1833 domain-containing protein [Lentisphaerae bacterium]|nr:DUF1833 domain-containing protein [Lentisphaerota bacterium]
MARQISATALAAIFAQSTEQVFLTLLEISHPSLQIPLRFVNNTKQITHGGNIYYPSAFDFRLPDDVEDNVPSAQITLDNTDRQIVSVIRELQTAPDITAKIILADNPDVIELGPLEFKLKEASYDVFQVTGVLSYEEDFLNQVYPRFTFNPRLTPGIF